MSQALDEPRRAFAKAIEIAAKKFNEAAKGSTPQTEREACMVQTIIAQSEPLQGACRKIAARLLSGCEVRIRAFEGRGSGTRTRTGDLRIMITCVRGVLCNDFNG